MLKRLFRLPSSVRFIHSKTSRFPFLTLKYKLTDNTYSRASVIISKKVSPKAVERNRLKRLVHVCLETYFQQLPHCVDILVIVHPQATTLTNEEVLNSIPHYLEKISV
jgi:ribonuclease P protein component